MATRGRRGKNPVAEDQENHDIINLPVLPNAGPKVAKKTKKVHREVPLPIEMVESEVNLSSSSDEGAPLEQAPAGNESHHDQDEGHKGADTEGSEEETDDSVVEEEQGDPGVGEQSEESDAEKEQPANRAAPKVKNMKQQDVPEAEHSGTDVEGEQSAESDVEKKQPARRAAPKAKSEPSPTKKAAPKRKAKNTKQQDDDAPDSEPTPVKKATPKRTKAMVPKLKAAPASHSKKPESDEEDEAEEDDPAPAMVSKTAAGKHPKYEDMIRAAMADATGRNGTSFLSIKNFILANYQVNLAILKKSFKKMIADGALKPTPKNPKGTLAGSFVLVPPKKSGSRAVKPPASKAVLKMVEKKKAAKKTASNAKAEPKPKDAKTQLKPKSAKPGPKSKKTK